MKSYSLFEINEYVKRVLALNFSDTLWIRAEIGQLNESGGHLFMDLVEKSEETDEIIARSEAVIWSRTFKKLRKQSQLALDLVLLEGNEVLLKVQVDFHERYGLKLIVEEIDGDYTIGKILIKRTEVLRRLEQEKLLQENASLNLPLVIQKVAVISSANAAGLQDYLGQMQNNPYGYDIRSTLFAATVQGDKAAKSMAQQLGLVSRMGNFDVAIIIRGGGARLDLSAFDEYEIGKAIANCTVPVITGVGHDVDETVADQVAHTDLKTPTAVADFIIHHNAAFEGRVEQQLHKIKELSNWVLKDAGLNVRQVQQNIAFHATKKWQFAERQIDRQQQSLAHQLNRFFNAKRTNLLQIEGQLQSLDVTSVLSKGFALLTKDGKKIKSVELLGASDHLNIMVHDGEIEAVVKKVKKRKT